MAFFITRIASIGEGTVGFSWQQWSYGDTYAQTGRISDMVTFEPDILTAHLDGVQPRLGRARL